VTLKDAVFLRSSRDCDADDWVEEERLETNRLSLVIRSHTRELNVQY
jgi:hypothetical protein